MSASRSPRLSCGGCGSTTITPCASSHHQAAPPAAERPHNLLQMLPPEQLVCVRVCARVREGEGGAGLLCSMAAHPPSSLSKMRLALLQSVHKCLPHPHARSRTCDCSVICTLLFCLQVQLVQPSLGRWACAAFSATCKQMRELMEAYSNGHLYVLLTDQGRAS